jgi:hypothetical protein
MISRSALDMSGNLARAQDAEKFSDRGSVPELRNERRYTSPQKQFGRRACMGKLTTSLWFVIVQRVM